MSKKHRLKGSELAALTREDGSLFHDAKGRPVELPKATGPIADTHGHLTHFHAYNPAGALARAAMAGVRLLGVPIDPTDDGRDPAWLAGALEDWVDNAAACIDELLAWGVSPTLSRPHELLENVRVWAGVHPYGAADFNASAEAHRALDELLSSPRAVGVGEIGLDYGPYNQTDPREQKKAFEEQLRLAHELNLPVELHIRDAEGDETAAAHVDAARILERVGVPPAGCDLHCYTSNVQVMQPYVEMGCFVAFGGAATFPRSEDIRDAAAACPQNLVLSETDSPYMTPVPLRGLECEPAMVVFNAELVATVREEAGVSHRDDTYAALWGNALRLFGIA
ncbi:MAG: TatD family hydrolase [Atopobiaceae bacterium]|nr:TatD family hydrolase [Atopobiaceae bacterium]